MKFKKSIFLILLVLGLAINYGHKVLAADTGSNELIPSTHKLGIGILNPSAALHVNGTSLFTNNGNFLNRLGIKFSNPNEILTVNGSLSLKANSVAPSASAGFGKLYVNSNTNKLFFVNNGGTSFNLLNGSSLDPNSYLKSNQSTS